ncbi:hypothetical protein B0T17DRAFT_87654 [Bombardia bombarda]|uniref:Uncharacterized protein n=1 Tax=Bombardia bombarda TaxID=252184 RepID=A0AA39XNU9_9PEZI|nr:hypothetical protein B0T17DRAFT_87654 [Bombardia bombarda]
MERFIRRPCTSWPFAANSTGRPRGTLNLGSRVGRVQVHEAIGEARHIFVDKLSGTIINHLNDNIDKLHDSASFVDLSLFMIGKSPGKTKPVVMFVSEDKEARIEAFRIIKDSGILKEYPAFSLGEMELKAEFENLIPLGSQLQSSHRVGGNPPSSIAVIDATGRNRKEKDGSEVFFKPNESIEVLVSKTGPLDRRHLSVKTGTAPTTTTHVASVGGVVTHNGICMLHSINHFLEEVDRTRAVATLSQPAATKDSDECEMTGLSDFEEEEEDNELIEVTSRGSASPDLGDLETTSSESGSDDTSTSTFSTKGLRNHEMDVPALQSRLQALESEHQEPTSMSDKPSVGIGEIVSTSVSLDSSFIQVDLGLAMATGIDVSELLSAAIPLENYLEYIENAPKDAAIRISASSGTISGILSGTPSFIRLPHSKTFQEVYVAKMSSPLVPGDCGSWVRNAPTGKLFGHVIAGSPTTGLVLLMPAAKVFAQALACFSVEDNNEITVHDLTPCKPTKQNRHDIRDITNLLEMDIRDLRDYITKRNALRTSQGRHGLREILDLRNKNSGRK